MRLVYAAVGRLYHPSVPSSLQLPRSSSRSSCTSIIAATSSFIVSFLVYFHHGYTTLTTVICQFFTSILALFALSSRQRVPLMSLHWRHEHQQNTRVSEFGWAPINPAVGDRDQFVATQL